MESAIGATSLRLGEVLQRAAACLRQKAVGFTPQLDAELLLGFVLGSSREALHRDHDRQLEASQCARFDDLVQRRLRHEPVAYITGEREFWSLPFLVTPDVLIPRPETEVLVESVLDEVRRLDECARPRRILDVGAGCGNIAISLASELTDWQVVALDLSASALQIARSNAQRLLGGGAVSFARADLRALPWQAASFALVAANVPYVTSADVDRLEPAVRLYEPRAALDGGPDGLWFIRALLSQASSLVAPGGSLHLEIGERQAPAVQQAVKEMPGAIPTLRCESVRQDLAGIGRIVVVRRLAAEASASHG